MTSSPSVAIIGGGLTGLVAALRLANNGYKVTVYESSHELGGLAASFSIQGEPLEKAYHHLFRTDESILSLVSELGLDDKLEWRESSVAIYRDGRLWPFMTPLDLLAFKPCSFIDRLRVGITALAINKTKDWRRLAGQTASEWMRKRCGESASRTIWEPLLSGKFSNHASEVSMAWLWARLHIRGNSREPGGGKERLGYFSGGFVEIVREIEKRLLEKGTAIHKNTHVLELRQDGAAVHVDTGGDGGATFDSVLFTGSNRALSRLLPHDENLNSYRKQLDAIKYLGAVCLVFETSQKLGDFYWTNVNEPDAPFLVAIRHTALIPASRYNGREIYYLGAYLPQDGDAFNQPREQLESTWFSYLKKIHPSFDPSLVGEKHLFRFKDAQHVVDCSYESKILPHETPVNGLFLSNFTQIFPEDRGTNFAVQEGEIAAEFLQKHLST